MAILSCPIPGHENDKVLIMTRRHIASMLKTIFLILFMVILPVIIMSILLATRPEVLHGVLMNFLVVLGAIYYLTVATFIFTQWVIYYFDLFILTDQEILDIDQKGLFDRETIEISLLRVQDVSVQVKGLLPTIFGYGDVIAESAGENSHTYVIDNVPDPTGIANRIMDLHNAHINRDDRAGELVTAEGDLRGQKPNQAGCVCPDVEAPAQTIIKNDQSQVNDSQGEAGGNALNEGGEFKL